MVGLWDVIAFGAFAMAAPKAELMALSSDPLTNPVPLLAERVWGAGKILVTLTGMIAMIGALVPCSTAASRLLMSLGRSKTLPRWLGYVHPKFQTPWHGLHLVYLVGALAVVPPALIFGPNMTIDWWGKIVVWFILAVYFVTNLSNIVYHRRFLRGQFNPLLNLAIPVAAMIIQILVLWQVVIVEPWNAGWTGRSAQIFILLSIALSAGYVVTIRGRNKALSKGSGAFEVVTSRTEAVGESLPERT
jgi:amino acid transporter